MTVAHWLRSRRWSVWLVALLSAVVMACSAPSSPASVSSTPTSSRATISATARPSDGLPTIREDQLPSEAQHTLNLIDAGGPFPFRRDGIVYHNNSGALPHHEDGWYHEYTVVTPGVSGRGPRRIVCGSDAACFWTADHYSTFRRIVR